MEHVNTSYFVFEEMLDYCLRTKYLYTDISTRRSEECEVVSYVIRGCPSCQTLLNFLNFYSVNDFREECPPTFARAIHRFNFIFDLLQSKHFTLFVCSSRKKNIQLICDVLKKERLSLTSLVAHYCRSLSRFL